MVDVSKTKKPLKACISFPIYGESCLADIGLCLYLAELPKSVQFESGEGRLPKAHCHGRGYSGMGGGRGTQVLS